LVEEPADILDELGAAQQSARTKSEDTYGAMLGIKSDPTSKFIALKIIDQQGCLFQAIQGECELSISESNAELIQLEAPGLIRQEGGRYFSLG
jgi:predicted Rossmann fold nucleotide-binding protein DprA/Smf involved in DNA uptake